MIAKFKKEQEESLNEEKLVIGGAGKKKDFLDHLFSMIIPRDHDIKYPDESGWRGLISRILAKLRGKK